MIKVVEHKFSRNTEILEMSGNDILLKRPMILANVNKKIILSKTASSSYIGKTITAAKEENAKKISAYHGQIEKNGDGDTDLVAEFNKHPEALWIRVKAIEADIPNDNGDCFSKAEIIKSYKTFEGVPVFTNHENDKVENAKGKVVKAEWDAKEAAVYCTMFIDRKASPSLCRAIEEGYVTDVSMGTQVEESSCSICNNRAADAKQYCKHVQGMKGRTFEGKRVYENNYGLKFIEISVVTDGACKDCTIREVLDPDDFLVKVAGAVEQFRKTGGFTKNGGQIEVQKLNQAMDLLEDVSKTMLGQRKFIDMDFLKKVTAVLADLQEVTDELVDQGYATMGVQQPQPSVPTPPPEIEMSGETPALTETEGVGKVTEPITNETIAASISEKREVISNIKERMKELNNNFAKINKEANEPQGGIDSVENKHKETTLKLAKIWENPSVKEYVTQFGDGEYTIVFSKDEIVGVKGGKRVASIKRASLDEDIRLEIEKNPSTIGKSLLEALRESEMSGKITTASNMLEETTEKQLDSKKDTSPRNGKDIEVTTEGQLDKQKSEYVSRQNKDIETTTEEQLASSSKGYDYHKRKEEDGEETTETRLNNKGIAGNSNPAGRTPASEGVKDQAEQTTGGQLNDWNKAEKGFSPKDETTEKQLESWGRKIASESDAKKAIAAGTKAITQTAIATGATPDEIINIVADIDSSDNNKIAAKKAVASLSANKDVRLALYRRSKFHGANKTASTETITNYLLGSLSDNGLGGEIGIKVLAGLIERKNAHAEISEAISTASAEKEEASIKTASVDFLKKVLAGEDESDSIVVQLKPEQIGLDKNESEFAETAFAIANRKAAESGIKISANVHVKKTTAGIVEVTMKGQKVSESSLLPKSEVSPAPKINIEARKEARLKLAQMGGAAPDPMAGGAAPAGGGTTMPPPPAAPGATPPISSLGTPPPADTGMGDPSMDDDSDDNDGEAVPPGSICPACGSENTDCKDSEFSCRDCGAEGSIEVNLRMKTWPGTVKETTPKKDGEDEEGGIGDASGGEGNEIPPLGIAATYKIKPEMIKKAGAKPLGSFCPYCASSNVKLACKNGCTKANCKACGGYYTVDMAINEKNEILARMTWADTKFSKFAAKNNKTKTDAKKSELIQALSQTGMTKKFASSNADTKIKIIGKLIEKGWLK